MIQSHAILLVFSVVSQSHKSELLPYRRVNRIYYPLVKLFCFLGWQHKLIVSHVFFLG